MAKATYYEERVDTTFIGYILMGFILLIIGAYGLLTGNLFGDDPLNWPVSIQVVSWVCSILGIVLLILTVFAYRTGQKTSAAVFAASGATMLILQTSSITGIFANSNWFLYIAVAVMFLVFAIYTILEEDHRLVTLLLVVLAVMFFFMALSCFFDSIIPGPGNDENLFHAMGIVYGIVAFIGFVLSTYIGLACSQPDKLPLV